MADPRVDKTSASPERAWVYPALLILVLLVGAYFRLIGVNWDEGHYLQPDERFLTMVETSIEPVQSLSEYFDTNISSLNPHNRGHGFFVYGTWPIFIVRYLAEWLGKTGFGEISSVGRPLSALVNLASVLLVYMLAERLYDRRVGLLAAAFASFSVLPIQLSHFFKEDTFMAFFTLLTLYVGVLVATGQSSQLAVASRQDDRVANERAVQESMESDAEGADPRSQRNAPVFRWWDFLFFGVALGMAVASKLNAAPVALALPVAVLIRISKLSPAEARRVQVRAVGYMVMAGLVSLLTFRILQPYAFTGPGFLDLQLNTRWLENLRELRRFASPDSIFGFPPSLQWANRPIWFSWVNMVQWGLGIPLGLLAWAGFLWVGWRLIKGEWQRHLLLWGWTAAYFIWQSVLFNPTMRYQLPVYPTLAIFAAWTVFRLWDGISVPSFSGPAGTRWPRVIAVVVGSVTLLMTLLWAYAFTRIYTRPVTRVEASRWIFQNIPGPVNVRVQTPEGLFNQPLPFPYDYGIQSGDSHTVVFTAQASGTVDSVYLFRVSDLAPTPGTETLDLRIARQSGGTGETVEATFRGDIASGAERDGQEITFFPEAPYQITEGESYELSLHVQSEGTAAITLSGAALANETVWDDGLPLRVDGYDPFSGIYRGDLNFQLYWDDNSEKVERFVDVLTRTDYILITSSRQWGSIPRLPDRYPLSTAYYAGLIDCSTWQSLESCYNQVEEGGQGPLGFELVKVFRSDPRIGPWPINDQASEEAFTVYDHPKVFILRKTEAFDPSAVRAYFNAIEVAPAPIAQTDQPSAPPTNLMLPQERLLDQRMGGTWSELFDPNALINTFQPLTVFVWYIGLGLLGWIVYPLVRLALPGLDDRGYPLTRLIGLLLLSYLTWVAGSFGVPFSRLTITVFVLLVAVLSGLTAYRKREQLLEEWRTRRRNVLIIEGLFLTFFLVGLAIRLGNPDLWHPWKGGEKPMDFSYFNAVLKSTTFPPYDPWFSGGYINYYYYGFVLTGVLVKWLGILPSLAYNLILPSLFALIALGAFSLGWNLFQAAKHPLADRLRVSPWIAGLAAACGMVVLGNLGTARMIYRGFISLAATGSIEDAGLLTRVFWAIKGFLLSLACSPLPYPVGDWYWNPSRAIPAETGNPITEFPFFTFLYADLHAHLIALPITLLVLAWALSVVLARIHWNGWASGVTGFLLGGLSIGALRPTNTWDFYPYLAIGCLALGYGIWRNRRFEADRSIGDPGQRFIWRSIAALTGIGVLVILSHLLYQPYANWYGQGYNTIEFWRGTHTPVSSFLVHWGVFLFAIVTWMIWEMRNWLAETPLSALRKLEPFRPLVQAAIVLLLVFVVGFAWQGVHIGWIVLPVAALAASLILRPGQPDAKRTVLFLAGTGLVLTLMVELIVLRGDIGRMNTVFKFYLQVWTLFAISAAAALGWLLSDLPRWNFTWRRVWVLGITGLIAAAALYPLVASLAKIKDRMTEPAPITLDGMAFMATATYNDQGRVLTLSEDFQAIQWLQENIEGSPVIVEANTPEYRWGTRFTIYTGLPGVVGWNWHQRQQRALVPAEWVTDRVEEVNNFYQTTDVDETKTFLDKYGVDLIVVGRLEQAYYPGPGLEKFSALEGVLWDEVYRRGETIIYEVIESPAVGLGS